MKRTPPPFDPDKLIQYLAVSLAAREIELLTIKHLLEQDKPGFLGRFEREFEALWTKYQAANILMTYRNLRDPDRSLGAGDMKFAHDPDEA